MQKARRHACPYGYSAPTACRHAVSGSIPPLPGIFPTFPYGTGALSVTWEYLALESGFPEFLPGSSYLTVLGRDTGVRHPFTYRAFTFYGQTFQSVRLGPDL